MWRHWRRLHPEARHLPAIVPVVVYNGPRPWRAPRTMYELYDLDDELREALGPHVLSCSFVLDDLSAVTDAALRGRRMDAYGRLCLFAMSRAAARDFLDRLEAWQVELRLVFRTADPERITSFLLYTFRVHRHTHPTIVRQRIAAVVGPEQENIMLSVAEQLIEEGRTQGLRAIVLRLLGRRFGAVPAQVAARVEAAELAELEGWCDRILDAASLDDVFDGA